MAFRRPTGHAFGVSLAASQDRASSATDGALTPLPASTRRPPPASAQRDALLALVDAHAAVVVVGDAGAGKTTAVPSFLADGGWCGGGLAVIVAVASPRAALLAAHTAAEAAGEAVGGAVGYAVAYEDVCTPVSLVVWVGVERVFEATARPTNPPLPLHPRASPASSTSPTTLCSPPSALTPCSRPQPPSWSMTLTRGRPPLLTPRSRCYPASPPAAPTCACC